jgi:hypothetical protein
MTAPYSARVPSHPTRSVMCDQCRRHARCATAYSLPDEWVRVGEYRNNKHLCNECKKEVVSDGREQQDCMDNSHIQSA